MITRGAILISRLAVLFAVLFTFTACGGGGGGGSDFYNPDDGDGGGNSDISFTLIDPDGNKTDTVTSAGIATLEVKIRNGGSGILVSATATIGLLLPETGTALTDNNGVATFQLGAGDDRGAGSVTATATLNDESVTGTFNFQVGDDGLRLGYFDEDGAFIENEIGVQPQETLAVGGNAQLTVAVVDGDGNLVKTAESVRFSSGCIAAGLAGLNPGNPISSANGSASSTYTASGCSGVDQVTATVEGSTAQAFGAITIASPSANAITFESATPTTIVLKGTGGQNRDETADVVFKVVDSTGAPLAGVTVALSLTTEIGGLSLSRNSALSNGLGEVLVTVIAGDVATTVRVEATVDGGNGETVATVSDIITVTTGLPDQDSISLGVGGDCNGFVSVDGMSVNNQACTLTVKMNDKFNNPVVDGTAAVFTTEYGDIDPSCLTGISNGEREGGTPATGECSVRWTSGAPRFPLLTGNQFIQTTSAPFPSDIGYTRGGRSTIVVRAQGEESFIDQNGNGVMDEAEKDQFKNLPEAFIDHNEDGEFTPDLDSCKGGSNSPQCIAGEEEIFFDYNNDQVYDHNDDPAVYNGLLCPPEGDGIWCSRSLVEVRDDAVVILGGNYIIRVVGATAYLGDQFNNPPGAATAISFKENDGCKLASGVTSITVPTLFFNGAFGFSVATSPSGGTLTISYPGAIPVTIACTAAPVEEEEEA